MSLHFGGREDTACAAVSVGLCDNLIEQLYMVSTSTPCLLRKLCTRVYIRMLQHLSSSMKVVSEWYRNWKCHQ
jgi:hypothetical protein